MTGCNYQCEHCNEWSDDHPGLDCCPGMIADMKRAHEWNKAEQNAQSDINGACLDLFIYCHTGKEVTNLSKKIVNYIKSLKQDASLYIDAEQNKD